MTPLAGRLGQARAALVTLPDDLDQLARCLTEKPAATGGNGKSGKVSASPAPLRLEVLHLVDDRRKPGWEGEDPRLQNLGDRYGAAAILESWTRVVVEEIPDDLRPDLAETATARSEAAVLVEVWPWVEQQQWAGELADDVLVLAGKVRFALGVRPTPRYFCPKCRSRAFVGVGGFLVCEEGHEESIRDLEGRYRRRPALATKDITEEFGVSSAQLWQWKSRKKITPVRQEGRTHYWLPWDVFCLLNTDVAAAIDLRDAADAG